MAVSLTPIQTTHLPPVIRRTARRFVEKAKSFVRAFHGPDRSSTYIKLDMTHHEDLRSLTISTLIQEEVEDAKSEEPTGGCGQILGPEAGSGPIGVSHPVVTLYFR